MSQDYVVAYLHIGSGVQGAVILDVDISAYLYPGEISPYHRAGPDIGISPYLHISDNIGSLADKTGIGYLGCLSVETSNHFFPPECEHANYIFFNPIAQNTLPERYFNKWGAQR